MSESDQDFLSFTDQGIEFKVNRLVLIPGIGFIEMAEGDFEEFICGPINWVAKHFSVPADDYMDFVSEGVSAGQCEALTRSEKRCECHWTYNPDIKEWIDAKGKRYCAIHRLRGYGLGGTQDSQ
jgi:hypothetical protein